MASVLIVDDEPAIAVSLEFLMRQEGHAVRVVGSQKAALAAADADPPDVVLLDVMLPDGSGIEVARALRQRHPAVRILMVSAKGREVDAQRGLAAGADGYLTKPFAIREVIARVAALLDA